MEDGALILNGVVSIKELDWNEANSSILLGEARHDKLVRDIHSLASSGTLSDFTFIVQGRKLDVHKAILAGIITKFITI